MRFIFKVWKQSEEYQWGFAHGIMISVYLFLSLMLASAILIPQGPCQ